MEKGTFSAFSSSQNFNLHCHILKLLQAYKLPACAHSLASHNYKLYCRHFVEMLTPVLASAVAKSQYGL